MTPFKFLRAAGALPLAEEEVVCFDNDTLQSRPYCSAPELPTGGVVLAVN
jgi:hypothetical protein